MSSVPSQAIVRRYSVSYTSPNDTYGYKTIQFFMYVSWDTFHMTSTSIFDKRIIVRYNVYWRLYTEEDNGSGGVTVRSSEPNINTALPYTVDIGNLRVEVRVTPSNTPLVTFRGGSDIADHVGSGTFSALYTYGEGWNGPLSFIELNRLSAQIRLTYNGTTKLIDWDNSSHAGLSTATITNYRVNLSEINPETDFIFMDPTTPKSAMLPPVALATGKPYFFKLTNNISPFSTPSSSSFLASDKSLRIHSYNGDSQIVDTNLSTTYILDNYGCLTLVSNGTSWYIANYYPSLVTSEQVLLGSTSATISNSNKIGTASARYINNFINNTDDRKSGDNQVNLPSASPPSICIVVYSGDTTSTRSYGNALCFNHAQPIDGYSVGNKPYIVSDSDLAIPGPDSNLKNSGIVFISNGTRWYIVGWYNGNSTTFYDAANPSSEGGEIGIVGTNKISFNIKSDNSPKHYYLPQQIPSAVSNDIYFIIVKQPGNQNNSYAGVTIHTYNKNALPSNYSLINNTRSICYTGIQSNACIWIVGVRDVSGSFIRYYPVIGYTPRT